MGTEVMLDLETMGTGPDAAIVAVGAIEFDVTTRSLGRDFYRVVSLESAVAAGGVMDAGTVMWWLRQDEAARKALCGDARPLRNVLIDFADWLAQVGKDVRVWGNGAAFDNVILSQAYKRAGLERPWFYCNDRCYRTVKALRPEIAPVEHKGTKHNALADATTQALHLMRLLGEAPEKPEDRAWECFCDVAYYGMWAVRPVKATAFAEFFHLATREEAEILRDILDGTRYGRLPPPVVVRMDREKKGSDQ